MNALKTLLSTITAAIPEEIKAAFVVLCGIVSSVLTLYLKKVIVEMIPWLVVAFVIIICDLICTIYEKYKLGEKIRFSGGWRDTLFKAAKYYVVVTLACTIDVAANSGGTLAKGICIFVCALEGCSIVRHLLKPHGVDVDLGKIISMLISKKFNIDNKIVNDAIKSATNKEEEKKDNGKD